RFDRPLANLSLQSFVGGAVTRLFLYETRGQAMLSAECAGEAAEDDLRREILRLAGGFGDLELGDLVGVRALPRDAFPTLEGVARLGELRARLTDRLGAAFVAGGWDAERRDRRFADVGCGIAAGLDAARAKPPRRRAAA